MYNDNHTLTTNITGVQIVHPAFTIFISFPWYKDTGSMGPPGQAPQGSSGAWNVSLCQYKNKKEAAQTTGASASSRVTIRDDHPVCI